MAGSSEDWPLVGRHEELAMLDERVGQRFGSMVVAGSVGVGKSRLLTGWLAELEERGRPTIVVRATKSTATIPFGAFARWVPEHPGDTRDRLGVLQATAARLAEPGPGLVVAVDDAQLLDDGSAALVLHLAQHGPASVLVTVRSGEPCPDAIVALWKEGLALRLDLQPLSEHQTVELLELALGATLSSATRRRLWQLSEGNPMYLRELVEAGRSHGVLAQSGGVWEWQGAFVGRTRLVELVRDRIGTTGSEERRVLEIVALGEPLPTEVLARLAPRELLAEIESRGLVITERESPRDPLPVVRLAHPLYSEVLRAELPTFTAQTHRVELAQAAIATGTHERHPLRVATWLLDSGAEAGEADLLMRASFLALVTADYELSARLARAAERAGGGWQATVRRAEALGPLRRWDEVDALLERLSTPDNDPEARAAAARTRAELSFWYRGEKMSVVRATLAEATRAVPAPARSSLLTEGARLAIVDLDLEEAIRLATAAAADAGTVSDRLNAVVSVGMAASMLGRTNEALAIVELASPYAFDVVSNDPWPGAALAQTYSTASVLAGRIDESAAIFQFLMDEDVAGIGGPTRALPAYWLACASLAQGRLRTATDLCGGALDLLSTDNNFEGGTAVAAVLATAAAQLGDHEATDAALGWIRAHHRVHTEPEALLTELARAWRKAANGELSAARDLAADAARRAAEAGAWTVELDALRELARFVGWSVAAPRLEELATLVEGPFADAVARFARAAAMRDGAGLDDVAARYSAMGAQLLAAEAAALAAEIHLADGRRRDHAASLATAQALAARCEGAATPLLARLDHAPVVTALTDREREVTELAARGHSSREIAAALTISVRTVDSHLNHAYTKLGISDRTQLPAALGHLRRPRPGD